MTLLPPSVTHLPSGAPQFYSMNRPVQQPQNPQVGGSLPFRRPSSVTGQPNTTHNPAQLNGGPHFAQNQGTVLKTGNLCFFSTFSLLRKSSIYFTVKQFCTQQLSHFSFVFVKNIKLFT